MLHALALLATLSCPSPQAGASELLPAPGGPHALGSETFHWVDEARADPFDEGQRRELVVQLVYPASGEGDALPYLEEPEHWVALYGPSIREVNRAVTPRARAGAEPAEGAFPVVLFSPGGGQSRHAYTALLEAWASHGFVVVALSHPHAGHETFPDGSFRTPHPDWSPPRELFEPARDAELYAFWEPMIDCLSQDQRFVLDQLEGGPEGGLPPGLAEHLDLTRVAVAGHSRGCKAAYRTARLDPRVDACVILDDPPPPPERAGARVPTLVLMPVEASEAMRTHTATLEAAGDVAGAETTVVELPDATHMVGFSDLPLFVPEVFHTDRATANRVHARVCEVTTGFLKEALGGGR